MRLDGIAFDLDGRQISLAEVFASAHIGGWIWTSLVEPVMQGLACVSLAEREGVAVPEDDLEAALASWKASHALVATERAAEWLEFHDLDSDDLGAYLERKLLAQMFADRLDEALAEAMIAPGEVMARVPEEAAFEGSLRTVVQEAALRMAAGLGRSDATRRVAEKKKIVKEHDLTKIGAYAAMARSFEVAPEIVEWLVDLEASYRARLRDIVREDALPRELDAARSALTMVEYASAAFATEAVAKEALRETRGGKESLETVAQRAGVKIEKSKARVAELEASAHKEKGRALATAPVGHTVGPFAISGAYVVHDVLARKDPRLTDVVVRRVLEKKLIDRALGPEVARRVRFHPVMPA